MGRQRVVARQICQNIGPAFSRTRTGTPPSGKRAFPNDIVVHKSAHAPHFDSVFQLCNYLDRDIIRQGKKGLTFLLADAKSTSHTCCTFPILLAMIGRLEHCILKVSCSKSKVNKAAQAAAVLHLGLYASQACLLEYPHLSQQIEAVRGPSCGILSHRDP